MMPSSLPIAISPILEMNEGFRMKRGGDRRRKSTQLRATIHHGTGALDHKLNGVERLSQAGHLAHFKIASTN